MLKLDSSQPSRADPEGLTIPARRLARLLFAVLVLAACDSGTPPLNSERIRQSFGSYGVEILQAYGGQRVSCLYSEDQASGKTCRTIAVVEFTQPVDNELLPEHERILTGQSIGEVFVDAGWRIDKRNLLIGETAASDWTFDLEKLMRIDTAQAIATHRYEFFVERGERRIHYATITEMHHPDYLDSEQLHSYYD